MKRTAAVVLALAASLGAGAASAHAEAYCVTPAAGCDAANTFADVQSALNAAQSGSGFDTVLIGAGTFDEPPGGFTYSAPDPVEIRGVDPESTVLRQAPGAGRHFLLSVSHSGAGRSRIRSIGLLVTNRDSGGGADFNDGLSASVADIDDIAVRATPAVRGGRGVVMAGGSTLTGSDVDMSYGLGSTSAVQADDGVTVIDGSSLKASEGLQARGGTTVLKRSRVTASFTGVEYLAVGVLENVLIKLEPVPGATSNAMHVHVGLGNDASLAARHVTVVGGDVNSSGLLVIADPTNSATGTLSDSIVRTQDRSLVRAGNPGGPPANLTAARNDFHPDANVQEFGDGTLDNTGARTDEPHFLGEGDFRLRHDSPLIDAGDASRAIVPETDLPGADRNVDGNGDGTAQPDLGAYEYQRRPPSVTAAAGPASAFPGEPFSWTATGSDPDGDPLSFRWAWDDGAAADGPSASRVFTGLGPHTGTVTVTDATGLSGAATARAEVVARPPVVDRSAPDFSIFRRGLRLSRNRQIAVRVVCAATEPEPCAGRLSLASAAKVAPKRRILKLGSARFRVMPGKTALVRVKVARRAAAVARRLRKVKVKVSATATDAAGNKRTVRRTLTLVIGRTRR